MVISGLYGIQSKNPAIIKHYDQSKNQNMAPRNKKEVEKDDKVEEVGNAQQECYYYYYNYYLKKMIK
jgi:hypothetical protein